MPEIDYKKLEDLAKDPEFKKHMEEIDAAEQAKRDELDAHPYMRAKRILDEEFELTISYPKTGVPIGHLDVNPELTIVESILTEENPGALITNDLYIIEITPDVEQVILAEENLNTNMFNPNPIVKDYTIHEYNRIKK